MDKIKLLCCDIDGTLTDSTVYYSEKGEELKQFSHRDGRGFHLIKELTKCKVALITSEIGGINKARGDKFLRLGTISDYIEGKDTKLESVEKLCKKYNIELTEIAFIGDDTNDIDPLKVVGFSACPIDAHRNIKIICNYISHFPGGHGAVRDIIDYMIEYNMFWKGDNAN